MTPQRLLENLQAHTQFVVTSHVSPDGDNAGSSLAMVRFLENLGKRAWYVLDDTFPSNVMFLFEEQKVYRSKEAKEFLEGQPYALIALDCGDRRRLALPTCWIEDAAALINVDHHISNDHFGDVNFVDPEASSTCEMVYRVAALQPQFLDSVVAKALYTGLITDTGNFLYESASPSTLRAAASLMEIGFDRQHVIEQLYQSNSLGAFQLRARVFQTLRQQGPVAWMQIKKSDQAQCQVTLADTEGLASEVMSVKDTEIGVLFKEKEENLVRVSLRSKKWANVHEIAAHFGGGGHKRAAGCSIHKPLEEAVQTVMEEVEAYVAAHRCHP